MMEEQYLKISKEQSKALNAKGFRTYQKTAVKDGQEKIVGYVINLSDILSFLEREVDILTKIKKKHSKLKKIDKDLEELRSEVIKKLKEIATLDITKTIDELVDKKLKQLNNNSLKNS